MNFKSYARKINFDMEVELLTPINAKENDLKSRYLEFTLFNNNKVVNLDGASVKFYAKKPDGHEVFNDCVNLENNKIILELTTQLLAVPGLVKCELMIINPDGALLTSKIFNINVLDSINTENAIKSSNEYGTISELIKDITIAKENLGILSSAIDALNSTINISINKDNELKATITQADNKINNLNSTISDANSKDSTLQDTIKKAESTNTTLNNTNAAAEQTKIELDELMNNAADSFVTKQELAKRVDTQDLTVSNYFQGNGIVATGYMKSPRVETQSLTGDKGYISGPFGQLNKFSSSNFNDYIAEGHYFISSDTGIENAPFGGPIYGKLIVVVSAGGSLRDGYDNDWCWQIFLHTDGEIHYRKNIYNFWTNWSVIGNNNDINTLLEGYLPIVWDTDYARIQLPPRPTSYNSNKAAKMILGIDMGHSLSGPGTGSSDILSEVDINRKVGKELIRMLQEKGHTVINCTVDYASSESEQLKGIVAKANAQRLDYFISLHLNSGGGTGTETYVAPGAATTTRNKATDVNNAVVASCNFTNRGIKEGNFYVLKNTTASALLVEICFVDSQTDANKLNTYNVAKGLFKGITGEEYVANPSPMPPVPVEEDFLRCTAHGLLPYDHEQGYVGHPNNKYFYEMCANRFTSYNYRMREDENKNLIFENHRDTTGSTEDIAIFKNIKLASDDLMIPVNNAHLKRFGGATFNTDNNETQYMSVGDLLSNVISTFTDIINAQEEKINTLMRNKGGN